MKKQKTNAVSAGVAVLDPAIETEPVRTEATKEPARAGVEAKQSETRTATTLIAFMVELATNADRLADFVADPKGVAAQAGLAEEDMSALFSGDTGKIYMRLAPEKAAEAARLAASHPQPSPVQQPAPSLPPNAGASSPYGSYPAASYGQPQGPRGYPAQQPYPPYVWPSSNYPPGWQPSTPAPYPGVWPPPGNWPR